MKTEMRNVYSCEYCKKYYIRKHFCERHEKLCKKRPYYYRPCFSCVHSKLKTGQVYSDYVDFYGYVREMEKDVKLVFCTKKEIYIYPPNVGVKGNHYDTGYIPNVEMPIECNLHEYEI